MGAANVGGIRPRGVRDERCWSGRACASCVGAVGGGNGGASGGYVGAAQDRAEEVGVAQAMERGSGLCLSLERVGSAGGGLGIALDRW